MEFNSIDSGELNAALAKAQAEMSNPKFDKTNPHFRNKFASLAAVRDAVLPILAKHGIACVQDLASVEGGVACTTILMHASGQRVALGPLKMPVSKQDAQGFGSAATYARRYHLMAVANVVGDEDDDANEATGKPAPAEDVSEAEDANVTRYAVALRKAVKAIDAAKVFEVHMDLHAEGEEMYRAVWAKLDPKTRAAAKDFIDLKKSEKVAA
jgi:hypothetical protein